MFLTFKIKIMRFDPRPRKANGTLATKLSREAYIRQAYGMTVAQYNAKFDEENRNKS